jgi:uncharacterized membrane protein YfhO
MFKKIVFYLGIALTLICAFSATVIQLIPFILALVLMGIHIYGKKDLRVWIIVVSAFMLFVNIFAVFSLPDMAYWILAIIAFAIR